MTGFPCKMQLLAITVLICLSGKVTKAQEVDIEISGGGGGGGGGVPGGIGGRGGDVNTNVVIGGSGAIVTNNMGQTDVGEVVTSNPSIMENWHLSSRTSRGSIQSQWEEQSSDNSGWRVVHVGQPWINNWMMMFQ